MGTTYADIKLGSKDGGTLGTLRCRPEGMVWESQARDRKVELKKEDVDTESVEWCQLGSKYQLRVQQSNGSAMRFEGFDAGQHRELKEYCDKTLGAKLTKMSMDVEGRNAGKVEIRGDELVFKSQSGKKVFDLCLPNVKDAQKNSDKSDLVLTFEQAEGLSKKHEGLVEMRFYVPDTELVDEDAMDDVQREKTVDHLYAQVLEHVSKEEDGEKVVKLEDVSCKYPRSTLEMTIFSNLLKLRSNTYDFVCPFKNIKRIFKVPSGMGSKPGHYLTVMVDPPLRKGQTHYPYIVLFFESDPDDEPEELRLNLPEDIDSKSKDHPQSLRDKIKPKMSGLMVDMVGDILRFCAYSKDNQVKVQGAKKFTSSANKDRGTGVALPAVKCSIGANVGQLYLMDNAFLFLEKPPLSFMYEDVEKITFDRNQSQQKLIKSHSFDFKIKLSNGKSQDFNQIPKAELKNMEQWFQEQSEQKYQRKKMVITNYKEDDDDDEGGGDDDDDDAGIKNRMKAQAEMDDDDSDEEDDDFEGGASSDSSSDPGSDDDDESGDGSGSDTEKSSKKKAKKEKKKKKKKEKEEKPAKKTKAKKDPNEPKRAKSSYMLFCDEQRAKVKAENPELSMTEMSKVIGAKWKELSAEEKKPFEDEAKKLAAQYKEDKAKYDEENPQEKKRKGEGSEGKKSKKAKKDPNAPKGKLSAYMIWCATEREKIKEAEPTLKQTEIMAKLGQLWRDMSADDKKPWEEKAKADKERFDEETKSYKASGGGEGSKKGKKDKMSVDDFEKAADDSESASASEDDDDDSD